MACQPLAPQPGRPPVPRAEHGGQVRAARRGRHGSYDGARRLQPFLDPLDPDRGMLRREAAGRRELATGQFAGALHPPQREYLAFLVLQPAGRLHRFTPLARQRKPKNRQVGEVGLRVGFLGVLLQGFRVEPGTPPAPPVTDLSHGDGDEPGPEPIRLLQSGQPVQDPHHRLLDHVVDVAVPVQGPPDDVVYQRQKVPQQLFRGLPVPGPRRHDDSDVRPFLPAHRTHPALPVRSPCRCAEGDSVPERIRRT